MNIIGSLIGRLMKKGKTETEARLMAFNILKKRGDVTEKGKLTDSGRKKSLLNREERSAQRLLSKGYDPKAIKIEGDKAIVRNLYR